VNYFPLLIVCLMAMANAFHGVPQQRRAKVARQILKRHRFLFRACVAVRCRTFQATSAGAMS
jgi:hypothetical protein